jgi:hypothetical protein
MVAGKASAMVSLDRRLLRDARHYITGINIHSVKRMMLAYERAVTLHNSGGSSHQFYADRNELKLRRFVFDCRMIELTERSITALQRANFWTEISQNLHDKCDKLDTEIDQVLGRKRSRRR